MFFETYQSQKADLDTIKSAIFCKKVIKIDFYHATKDCSEDGCSCENRIEMKTILDFYANLYYLLNNENTAYYEQIVDERPELYEQYWNLIDRKWKVQEINKYQNPNDLDIDQTDFLKQFHEDVQATEDGKALLVYLFVWLFVLDNHFYTLKREYECKAKSSLPIQTVRGNLLYKRTAKLHTFLKERKDHLKPDPNYLLLRNYIENFHLVKANHHYPYRVHHVRTRSLKFSDLQADFKDLKIGFLPGKFDLHRDYQIKTEDIKGDRVPFFFEGPANPNEYYAEVVGRFKKLLDQNPHFILLPELFTPLPLQKQLNKLLKEHRIKNISKNTIEMVLSGSFHERKSAIINETVDPDPIYNYAQILNGSDKPLAQVVKMNRFIYPKDDKHAEPFNRHPGLEMNAYDVRVITLLETVYGRIAVVICVDILNTDLTNLLIDYHVDFVLVMAMTPNPGRGKFLRVIHEVSEKNQAVTMICNNLGVNGSASGKRVVVNVPSFALFSSEESDYVETIGNMFTLS
ncbi:hypothetical protein [Ammoniphilus resinae]|uniref:Amidohydrolase n=1 Tax=Ammoniphilus resinae TaxID=861532 RepID=A0ABS4GXJ3_9BACL|nr:hypothetical protein [Ammoniphilus resinae]MBP1934999.1 putative amidohydrolase [Ammoniphilus resinae]